MAKVENRIFKLNDEIAALRAQEEQVFDELTVLRHLDDDARRDALVSDHPIDRADAQETAGDVARMENNLADLRRTRERVEAKRDRLLGRL